MDETAEACFINIGPGERRKRATVGVIGLVAGAGLAAALILLHIGWLGRLSVLAPFIVGATGIFQAREKT